MSIARGGSGLSACGWHTSADERRNRNGRSDTPGKPIANPERMSTHLVVEVYWGGLFFHDFVRWLEEYVLFGHFVCYRGFWHSTAMKSGTETVAT